MAARIVLHCAKCGLTETNPRFDQDTIDKFRRHLEDPYGILPMRCMNIGQYSDGNTEIKGVAFYVMTPHR